jgi:signal transduction histidine kinase
MYLANGTLNGAYLLILDITTRKQAEQVVRNYSARLRNLSRRLLDVQEESKRYLARELHDEFGQSLTGLKFTLETIQRQCNSSAIEVPVTRAMSTVVELISRTQKMSLSLRPLMLDDFGLLATLNWHIEQFFLGTHIRVLFTHEGIEGNRFPPEVETAAFRIVQEGLTNVARHARVRQVELRVRADSEHLLIRIVDNGHGFDVEKVLHSFESAGLLGMQERAELVGGQFMVHSTIGGGSTIKARLPVRDDFIPPAAEGS